MKSIDLLSSIGCTVKFGGVKLLCAYIKDKFCGTNIKKEVIYDVIKNIPEKEYERKLAEYYNLVTLKKINIQNPTTFNEKVQWLKLYDPMKDLKTCLADKYAVREWIKEKVGEKYLIPSLGVWNDISEIDVDALPDKFVLKTNHGCGTTMVIKNKAEADWDMIKAQYNEWLSTNYAFFCFEPHYRDIEPKIIAEEYIEQSDGNLYDYKIHCFDGKPLYIHVIGDRDFQKHIAREAFFDADWNMQSFTSNVYPRYENTIKPPAGLQEMLKIAEVLSKDFAYVRVDLYELEDGNIKFGEMTFTPGSGMYCWNPPQMDEKWGELLKLPND